MVKASATKDELLSYGSLFLQNTRIHSFFFNLFYLLVDIFFFYFKPVSHFIELKAFKSFFYKKNLKRNNNISCIWIFNKLGLVKCLGMYVRRLDCVSLWKGEVSACFENQFWMRIWCIFNTCLVFQLPQKKMPSSGKVKTIQSLSNEESQKKVQLKKKKEKMKIDSAELKFSSMFGVDDELNLQVDIFLLRKYALSLVTFDF